MVSIQRTFLGHISHRWLDQCIPSSDLTISVQGKAKSWLDVLVLILFLIQHAHVSDVPAEPPSLFLERCVSLAICVVPRIDGRRCAHVTSSDGNDQRPADAPLPVVHVRTERREEMGRRLTRCRVRRAVGRTAPFEHGVRVVLATSTFNVRSTQRLATRVAFPILFPSGSSDEYTDRACTRIPIRENIFITNRRRSTRTYTFLPCTVLRTLGPSSTSPTHTEPLRLSKESGPPASIIRGFSAFTYSAGFRCGVAVARNASTFNTNVQYLASRIGSGMRYVLSTYSFLHSSEPVVPKTPAPACSSAEASLSPCDSDRNEHGARLDVFVFRLCTGWQKGTRLFMDRGPGVLCSGSGPG